jgi:hypothetical protein
MPVPGPVRKDMLDTGDYISLQLGIAGIASPDAMRVLKSSSLLH